MTRKSLFVLPWLAALLTASAAAQTPTAQPATPIADTSGSRTAAATTTYRSVFDQYVPANEDKPVGWREANALVGSIGGWRVYAREAQSPAAGATPPSAPASKAQPPAPANSAPSATPPSSPSHKKH